MKVQYNLDGILTPSTEVEIGGSIYFIKNVYSSYYQLDMVLIEGGRLCVYYKTTDSLPQNLMVRRNYVKLYPHIGSVGIVILQNDAHDHVDADVTYDLVTCEPDEMGKAYFHHRRYKATVEYPRCYNLTTNASDRALREMGFTCVEHEIDDGINSIEVYSAGSHC